MSYGLSGLTEWTYSIRWPSHIPQHSSFLDALGTYVKTVDCKDATGL